MRIICASVLLCLAATAYANVDGIAVRSIAVTAKAATITVQNNSSKEVTNFSLEINETFNDSHVNSRIRTEEFGPFGKTIGPHQTFDEVVPLTSGTKSVDAKVVVVIYKDLTAEADRNDLLIHSIEDRANYGLAVLWTLGALETGEPIEGAGAKAQRLQQLLTKVQADRLKSDQPTTGETVIQGAIAVMQQAPKGEAEREFIKEQITYYRNQAVAFTNFQEVRRVQ